MVPIDEHGDAAGGGGVQCAGGDAVAAAICGWSARALCVSGVAVGGREGGVVRVGSGGSRIAGMGLPGVERSAVEDQRLVHAKAADAFAGGGSGTDASVVGPRGAAAGTISFDDWQVSGSAGATGVGSGAGGGGAVVHRGGIAGLFAGARENVERGEHEHVGAGAGDDRGGMVVGVLEV